ncbi:MAG TPA: hypothetical protein VH559_05940 [Gemmatimonadaceae bacterium]
MPRTFVLAVLLAACTIERRPDADSAIGDSTRPASAAWIVRPDSVGPIPLGASIAQAAVALGDSINADLSGPNGCVQVEVPSMPAGTSLMALRDSTGIVRIERVDIDTAGILTAEGAGVGDPEPRVVELYRGRVSVQPHKYTGPEGHYVIVTSPRDTMFQIIFETDGRRVLNYRAGRRPAVEFVEGCS